MSVNLELFKVFYTVVKVGSITRAAKELFISQPAVSQSIKQLEDQLGGRLFVRTSKGMELTPEGAAIFEYVERATSLLAEAENKFNQLKNLMIGTIRIGASDNICKNFLLPYIKTFHNMYPDVIIQITNGTSRETVGLLKSGKVDVGFVNFPVINEHDLDSKECDSLNDCFVCGSKFLEFSKAPVSIETLSRLPLILIEKGTNTRRFIDDFFDSHDTAIKPEFELGSHDLLLEFAKMNLGIACVTEQFVTKELENGTLHKIKLVPPIPARNIGYIKLKNVAMTFASQRFLEIIEEKIKL